MLQVQQVLKVMEEMLQVLKMQQVLKVQHKEED